MIEDKFSRGEEIASADIRYAAANYMDEAEEKNMLGETKYGPGSEPRWKAGRTRYPDFYKDLLEEPSRTKRSEMLVADHQSTRIQ